MAIVERRSKNNGNGGNSYTEVPNRLGKLALNAKIGDLVKVQSTNTYFILTALPASSEGNWKQFFAILNSGYSLVTPSAGTANIDFVSSEVATIKLDCIAQTADVAVTVNAFPEFAQVIIVRFGPTAINLDFGIAKQAGGGGSIVNGIANTTMLITIFFDSTDIFISPQIYA